MVQHPGCEPQVKAPSGTCLENNDGGGCSGCKASHKRKFMQSCGDYVSTSDFKLHENKQIRFWGEYEMDSLYQSNPRPPYNRDNPSAVHLPIFPSVRASILNTDPLVFGDHFYYSCCRFPAKPLVQDDVVLFGTYYPTPVGNRFFLDTFFVVRQRISTSILRKSNKLFDLCTPSTSPLHNHVYEASMYYENKDYYSFVPCRPLNDFFGRPQINSYNALKKLSSTKDVFDEVVRQVKAQGFDLGVRMNIPPKKVPATFPSIP